MTSEALNMDMGLSPTVVGIAFPKYNGSLNSTEFVTIFVYNTLLQLLLQCISSFWGFAPMQSPLGICPWTLLARGLRPFFCHP